MSKRPSMAGIVFFAFSALILASPATAREISPEKERQTRTAGTTFPFDSVGLFEPENGSRPGGDPVSGAADSLSVSGNSNSSGTSGNLNTSCALNASGNSNSSDTSSVSSISSASGGTNSNFTVNLALRTNLLFDAMGASNIGIEVPLGRHFSIAASGAFDHLRIQNTYAMQTLQGGLDVKYWFGYTGGRKGKYPAGRRLTGWNVGVYGVYSGPWSIQWKQGWQGDSFFTTGITAGYSTPIAKHLNLEFALGAGWFFTPEARHYHRLDGKHLMWQQTRRNVGRFSLTRAQVNFVWLIGRNKK